MSSSLARDEAGPLRWGAIGASTILGGWVGPAINKVSKGGLLALQGSSPTRVAEVSEQLGIERRYSDVESLVNDHEVDCVYISSMNSSHAAQAVAALSAGKHVLCDKPLATSVADGEAMLAAAAAARCVLATNHQLRATHLNIATRECLRAGLIGRPLAVRAIHASLLAPEWRGWRVEQASAGAGVVLDLTVHSVDLLRFILDDDVHDCQVVDACQGLARPGIPDAAATSLRFRSGTVAALLETFTTPFGYNALEVLCSNGMLRVPEAFASYPREAAVATIVRDGGEEVLPVGRRRDPYEATVRAFEAAVRGEGAPLSTGEDGLEAMRAVLGGGASEELFPVKGVRR